MPVPRGRRLTHGSARAHGAAAAAGAVVCAVLLTGAGSPSAAGGVASASDVRWGRAEEVPGLAVLNAGRNALVSSVSCHRAGDCGAGGSYTDGTGHGQAFVVSQRSGRWHSALEVPGTAVLNAGGRAGIGTVSCASAGDCSAGGSYTDGSGHGQGFVASETNWRWGMAEEVPGLAALNRGGGASLSSVSCASAGNCSAGGSYTDSSGHSQVFVVSEKNGRWGKAEEVPGTAALNKGEHASLSSVSCASPGNCAAGGNYLGPFSTLYGASAVDAFVASEKNGRWGKAEEVPGTAASGVKGDASVSSVSCPSAGNCTAGGYYSIVVDASVPVVAFVVSQKDGRWGKAKQVPGLPGPSANQAQGAVNSVSCPSAGNCAAGGWYAQGGGYWHAFVAVDKNGRWGKAEEVPGTAAHAVWYVNMVTSVSCPRAGDCGAGGVYGYPRIPFVVSETNGRWGKAEEVPGTAALNLGQSAVVGSVSCPSAATCVAAGSYTDGNGHAQAFVGGAK